MATKWHMEGPIRNPVTGEAEEIYLDKPTGFTSERLTLGANEIFRVAGDFNFDHSGKYGEYSNDRERWRPLFFSWRRC